MMGMNIVVVVVVHGATFCMKVTAVHLHSSSGSGVAEFFRDGNICSSVG